MPPTSPHSPRPAEARSAARRSLPRIVEDFGVVDGEEQCGGTHCPTRRAVLRASRLSPRTPRETAARRWLLVRVLVVATFVAACRPLTGPARVPVSPSVPIAALVAFIDTAQRRTFDWFWETTYAANGLVPDRWPRESFSSVAAVGFGLTSYLVGIERGWITRDQARDRVLTTLRFFWTAPQGADSTNVTGYRGFFYHFLDMERGLRFKQVELSTIDPG